MKYEWMDQALCAQVDPEAWFPDGSGQHARAALRICAECPVRVECGEHAQTVEDSSDGRRYGAWGGLSASARSRQTPANAERDRQILALTAQGFTAAEIGDRLGTTGRTVVRVRAVRRRQESAADRRKRRPPAVCGTRSGYQKHRRDGEPACDACRQANADADRRLRNTGTTKAPTPERSAA